jgi:hypothetical protein
VLRLCVVYLCGVGVKAATSRLCCPVHRMPAHTTADRHQAQTPQCMAAGEAATFECGELQQHIFAATAAGAHQHLTAHHGGGVDPMMESKACVA